MICRNARKWISLELDGELSVRRSEKLYYHIRRCHSCRSTRDKWVGVGSLLREYVARPAQTPEAAWADVQRALRTSGQTARNTARIPAGVFSWRWATAAAAALALCGVLGLWWRARGPNVAVAHAPAAEVEWVETDLPGASTMVYEDGQSGWLVIWVVEYREREGDHAGS